MIDHLRPTGVYYIDSPGATVSFWYPDFYAPPMRLRVGLDHVRAANDITIVYDGDRDGWVICMDRTKDLGGCAETIEENIEVAFIPAWLEET